MPSFIKRFLDDQNGATAIEYGLLAAAIGLTIVAAVAPLGDYINTTFVQIQAALPR